MALESDLPIPGESSFPFPGLYKPPATGQEEGTVFMILECVYRLPRNNACLSATT